MRSATARTSFSTTAATPSSKASAAPSACTPLPARLRFRQPLMQAGPDLVGRVGLASTLIARHQHSPGGHPDQTGQPDPLPHVAHSDSLPMVLWWTPAP